MGAVNTTYTFTATDTITSTKMNDIIDQTTFTNDAVFDTTLAVASGKLKVNSQGITSNELAANAVTTDKIATSSVTNDKLSTSTGEIGAEWQSYTPVFTLGGGSSSNGNAVITGKYIQIGKTVHFRISYILGTTTAFNNLTFVQTSLPTSVKSNYEVNHPIGSTTFTNGVYDSPGTIAISSNNVATLLSHYSLTNNIVYANVQAGPSINIPMAFSANSSNKFLVSGCYEVA